MEQRTNKEEVNKIIVVIEKANDYYDAYSENCDGIYAAGGSVEDVKKDVLEAIKTLEHNLPEKRWPKLLKGDYTIEWKLNDA